MGPARPEPALRLSKGLSKDNPCAVFRPTRAVTRPPPRVIPAKAGIQRCGAMGSVRPEPVLRLSKGLSKGRSYADTRFRRLLM